MYDKVDTMNTFVFCTDINYLRYMTVAILSLLKNATSPVKIYCLHDESVQELNLQHIKQLSQRYSTEIIFKRVDIDILKHLKTHSYFTTATFIRISIPNFLTDEKKVIYLDSDLIVSKDLSTLFNLNIDNYALAGVYDRLGESRTGIKISKKGFYINSGVMLLNLDSLRRENFFEKCLNLYENFSQEFTLVDQCIINKCAHGKVLTIGDTWNHLTYANSISTKNWNKAKDKKAIFHFSGRIKPWHMASRSYISEFWWSYANEVGDSSLQVIESNDVRDLYIKYLSLKEDSKFEEGFLLQNRIIESLIKYVNELNDLSDFDKAIFNNSIELQKLEREIYHKELLVEKGCVVGESIISKLLLRMGIKSL